MEVVDDNDEEEEEEEIRVIMATEGLPVACDLPHDHIFIRFCHDFYYEAILTKLAEGDKCVSLTGTPGIGKSVFYQDFFRRYRRDNPEHRALAAAYNKNGELKQARVYHPNEGIVNLGEMPKYNEHECDIYLIDGAPKTEPTAVQAAVIFTSPKEDWFDQMRKYPNHGVMYFLNWTFPELQLANKALNLEIKDSALWERYLVFGGTARYTLSRKQEFVNQGLKDLNDGLKKIGSFEQLKKCFDKQKEMKDVVHRLMTYVPNDPNNLSEAPMVFASRHTSRMVYDRLKD